MNVLVKYMKNPFRFFWLFSIPFLSLLSPKALSQNLVYNGSFEEITECCERFGMIEDAKGWFRITGSADIFKDCCGHKDIADVPKNFSGWQNPQEGKAYAGLYLLADDKRYKDFYSREYLHTRFQKKLIKGEKYKLSFYLSFGEVSKFYTDRISVSFSSNKNLKRVDGMNELLKGENVVTYKFNSKEATDTLNWYKIEVEYRAKGGEEYLVIGSFAEDFTKQEYKAIKRKNKVMENPFQNKIEPAGYAYYFIDNVSLVPIAAANSNTLKSSEKTEY